MKQNAARSTREQAADGASSFKEKKTVNKIIIMKNDPSTVISKRVENALNSFSAIANLKKPMKTLYLILPACWKH